MSPTRATPPGNGPEQTHVDRIHLQVTRDTDRPSKIASREALAKRRAQPVTCIGQHTTEAHASGKARVRSDPLVALNGGTFYCLHRKLKHSGARVPDPEH